MRSCEGNRETECEVEDHITESMLEQQTGLNSYQGSEITKLSSCNTHILEMRLIRYYY